MGVIGNMQSFTQGYIMTNDDPNNSSMFYVLLLYSRAFQYPKMGMVCAMTLVLFIVIDLLTALTAAPFLIYFKKSLILVATNIVGKVLSSSLCAFGFARIRFRGRSAMFATVMITMMIRCTVLMIPQFMMWNKLCL